MQRVFGYSPASAIPVPYSVVDDDAVVLRFVPKKDDFIPPNARLPTRKAFEPSSDDLEEARALRKPVAVSVWNRQLTSVAQARVLMASDRERAVYQLRVAAIHAIGKVGNEKRLRVTARPFIPSTGPGSDGHCGIEGCDRPPGRSRKEHTAMLDKLADCCSPVAE